MHEGHGALTLTRFEEVREVPLLMTDPAFVIALSLLHYLYLDDLVLGVGHRSGGGR